MSKPVIAIASYQRPQAKLFARLDTVTLDKYVFVREDDYRAYEYLKEKGFKLVKLKNVTELGITRQKVAKYFQKKEIDWVFLLDDDITHVEMLGQNEKGRWETLRRLNGKKHEARVEMKALKEWFKWAKENDLSLSGPIPRFKWYGKGKNVINGCDVIQCVLINIPDIIECGNYEDSRIIGASDVYIEYKLMTAGFNIGLNGFIEYDCPAVGSGSGGCNAAHNPNLEKRYNKYVKVFFKNVCDDEDLIRVKITKTGLKAIHLNFKNIVKRRDEDV